VAAAGGVAKELARQRLADVKLRWDRMREIGEADGVTDREVKRAQVRGFRLCACLPTPYEALQAIPR
jgi:hypothetical protein